MIFLDYTRGVIISEVPVLTFGCAKILKILNTFGALTWISESCQYPRILKILNTFGALTWIPEFCQYPKILKIFSMFRDLIGTRSHPQIWVLMSMHQMYSKFSGTDKIWVSAFTLLGLVISRYPSDGYYDTSDKIRVFTSIHQIYSKFSKFSRIRMSVPELRILWHLSTFETMNNLIRFKKW